MHDAPGELAVFRYALAAWRATPDVPSDARAFSIHRENGTAALFGVLAGASLMEAALVHLVVRRWSPSAAWILTVLSVYGAVWLIGMARSLALLPVLVTPRELVLRSGMMWTLRVPRATIAGLETAGTEYDLKIPPAAEPNLVVRLREPLTAAGIFGVKRRVTAVAVAIDNPAEFERALGRVEESGGAGRPRVQ